MVDFMDANTVRIRVLAEVHVLAVLLSVLFISNLGPKIAYLYECDVVNQSYGVIFRACTVNKGTVASKSHGSSIRGTSVDSVVAFFHF